MNRLGVLKSGPVDLEQAVRVVLNNDSELYVLGCSIHSGRRYII